MSEQKITVELTEAEARWLLGDRSAESDVREGATAAIRAALPPEYAEGTIAWVTRRKGSDVTERRLCVRAEDAARYGGWYIDPNQGAWFSDAAVEKVEPLRVLADDEIAVKRISGGFGGEARLLHDYAGRRAEQGYSWAADIVHAYADALEAEEARRG